MAALVGIGIHVIHASPQQNPSYNNNIQYIIHRNNKSGVSCAVDCSQW